jgi:hypothetical protein
LDYRAHKLYWLLMLPVRIAISVIVLSTAAVVALYVGNTLTYPWFVKLVIAYIAVEIACSIVGLILLMITKIPSHVFFWLIDVIPTKGRNEEKAHAIVLGGPLIWLTLKLEREIENWTDRDTAAFVAALPWRIRLFNSRELVEERLAIMRDYYERTGQQLSVLGKEGVKKLVAHLEPPWLARMFINPYVFYAVVRFMIVFVCIVLVQ